MRFAIFANGGGGGGGGVPRARFETKLHRAQQKKKSADLRVLTRVGSALFNHRPIFNPVRRIQMRMFFAKSGIVSISNSYIKAY